MGNDFVHYTIHNARSAKYFNQPMQIRASTKGIAYHARHHTICNVLSFKPETSKSNPARSTHGNSGRN